MTGRSPAFIDILKNFNSVALHESNLIEKLYKGTVVTFVEKMLIYKCFVDPSWKKDRVLWGRHLASTVP